MSTLLKLVVLTFAIHHLIAFIFVYTNHVLLPLFEAHFSLKSVSGSGNNQFRCSTRDSNLGSLYELPTFKGFPGAAALELPAGSLHDDLQVARNRAKTALDIFEQGLREELDSHNPTDTDTAINRKKGHGELDYGTSGHEYDEEDQDSANATSSSGVSQTGVPVFFRPVGTLVSSPGFGYLGFARNLSEPKILFRELEEFISSMATWEDDKKRSLQIHSKVDFNLTGLYSLEIQRKERLQQRYVDLRNLAVFRWPADAKPEDREAHLLADFLPILTTPRSLFKEPITSEPGLKFQKRETIEEAPYDASRATFLNFSPKAKVLRLQEEARDESEARLQHLAELIHRALHPEEGRKRRRRFAFLASFLIGGVILGLFSVGPIVNGVQVTQAKAQMKMVVRKVATLETENQRLKDQYSAIHEKFILQGRKISTLADELERSFDLTFTRHYLNQKLDYLEEVLDSLEIALMESLHQHLSVRTVNPRDLRSALDELGESVRKENLRPVSTDLSDYYGRELSYVLTEDVLVAFVVVPLAAPDSNLDLFEYQPMQHHIDSTDLALEVRSPQPFIAWNHLQSAFLLLDDLNDCQLAGGRYFCERANFLLKEATSHCLSSLFMMDLRGVKTLCDHRITQPQLEVRQLSQYVFLVNHPRSLTLSIQKCGNPEDNRVENWKGTRQVTLGPSCMGVTPMYTLTPRERYGINVTLVQIFDEEVQNIVPTFNYNRARALDFKIDPFAKLTPLQANSEMLWQNPITVIGETVGDFFRPMFNKILGTIFCILGIIVALMCCWPICVRNCCHHSRWHARPRYSRAARRAYDDDEIDGAFSSRFHGLDLGKGSFGHGRGFFTRKSSIAAPQEFDQAEPRSSTRTSVLRSEQPDTQSLHSSLLPSPSGTKKEEATRPVFYSPQMQTRSQSIRRTQLEEQDEAGFATRGQMKIIALQNTSGTSSSHSVPEKPLESHSRQINSPLTTFVPDEETKKLREKSQPAVAKEKEPTVASKSSSGCTSPPQPPPPPSPGALLTMKQQLGKSSRTKRAT